MQLSGLLTPVPSRSPIPYAGRRSHLLRLPSGHSLRTMPPLSARPASSGTKTRSSAAPDLSFLLLLLLGVQGDENDWERNAYVFVISQSSAVSRSETVSQCTTGTRAPTEEMESALARALPASLHTFLFRIRGWLHEQAAGIGEELDKMQFRTWKPCLPFREEDKRRNRRALTEQRALPTPPAATCLSKLPGKGPLPARAWSLDRAQTQQLLPTLR